MHRSALKPYTPREYTSIMPSNRTIHLAGSFATVQDVQAQITTESHEMAETEAGVLVGEGVSHPVASRSRYVLLVTRRAEQLLRGRANRADRPTRCNLDAFDKVIRRRSESPIVEKDSPRDPSK